LIIQTVVTKPILNTYQFGTFLGWGGLTTLAKIEYDYLIMQICTKILFLQTPHYITYL